MVTNGTAKSLADVPKHITDFRRDLYNHLSQKYDAFSTGRAVVDAECECLPEFANSNRRIVMNNIGSRIFERGRNFDNGCEGEFWFDTNAVLPIVAHKYQTTFVCYSDSPQGNNLPNKSTTVAFYDKDVNWVVMYYFRGEYLTPPPMSICLVHLSGVHYELLTPPKTLNEMFKTVVDFGFNEGFGIPNHNREASLRIMAQPVRASPSPPSVNVPNKEASDLKASSSSSAKHSSLLSDGALREASYSVPIDSTSYFDKKEVIDGCTYDKYRPLTSTTKFTKKIAHRELFGKLNCVVGDGGQVIRVDIADEFVSPGDWFKDHMREFTPQHIVLRAQNTSVKMLPTDRKTSGRSGRKPSHPYIILFDGGCTGTCFRSSNSGNVCCTTKYNGGLTLEQLNRFASAKDDTDIVLQIEFTGFCIHKQDKDYGALNGRARKRKIEQVRP